MSQMDQFPERTPIIGIEYLTSKAEVAFKQGDFHRAYLLSLQATELSPQDINAWLLRAQMADSLEEAIICLSCANSLDPTHPLGQLNTYQAVRKLLHQNPYLAYLEETKDLYQVRNGNYLSLSVPKKRERSAFKQASSISPLKAAYRWLILSLFGLLLAGTGTILFAPLAVVSAFWANRQPLTKPDRIRSVIVIGLAGGLWVVGMLLSSLLFSHLKG